MEFCKHALDMRQKLYPPESYPVGHPDLANNLSNLGSLFMDRREYTKALEYKQQALVMGQKLYPHGHPRLAFFLNSLGGVFYDQGEYGKALENFQQARIMYQKLYPTERFPQGHPDLANTLNSLGLVFKDLGEHVKAVEYCNQGLIMIQKLYSQEQSPQRHSQLAKSLASLSLVFKDHRESVKALQYSQEALAIAWKRYPPERYPHGHPDLVTSFGNLGGIFQDQGEHTKALEYYQQALRMQRELYPPERYPLGHPKCASILNSLGSVLHDLREYKKAIEQYEAALLVLHSSLDLISLKEGPRVSKSLHPDPLVILILLNRGLALKRRLNIQSTAGAVRDCEQAYSLAAAVHDRFWKESLGHENSKLQAGEETGDLIPIRVGLCERLFHLEKKSQDLQAAFAAIEQDRARVFLESLGQANASRLAGLSPELRYAEESLQGSLRQLDARLRAIQNQPGEEAAANRLDLWQQRQKAENAFTQFERKLAESNLQYAALRYPKPCKLADARHTLTDREVALLFAVGEETSYAVVVQARPKENDPTDGLAVVRLPGRRDLAEKVAALTQRERLEKLEGTRCLGADLFQMLLKPLKEHIGGKDLVIVPDGPLCLLPFELLVEDDADTGRFLIEKRGIRYAPSLTALHMVRLWEEGRKTKPDRPLFALGDPIFDKADKRPRGDAKVSVASREALREVQLREGNNAPKFIRLLASGDEVRGLAKLLGNADAALTDDKATEAAVKAASKSGELARCRYVHFATHGILGIDRNEPPALVLSLVGTSGSDDEYGRDHGFLRLPEVSALKLNADLVVLSACRSGQGRMHNTEGVSGLARVFLYAGSRGVVCSLWSVDDAATSTLMQTMYKNLKAGQETAVALRNAKLAMICDDYPPLYWAPFIHLGR